MINTEKVDISSLNGSITRSEVASLLVELYEKSTNTTVIHIDFPFTDEEYQNAIDEDVAKIYTLGIMNGYEDMKFHPDWNLTNAETIAVIYRTVMKVNSNLADKHLAVPEYDSISSDSTHWATSYLYGAKRLGLLDGVCYDSINIDHLAIRKDVIGIIANAFYQLSKPVGNIETIDENTIRFNGEEYISEAVFAVYALNEFDVLEPELAIDENNNYIEYMKMGNNGKNISVRRYEFNGMKYYKLSDYNEKIKPLLEIK